MDSNLITPPDIIKNSVHSVLLIDPDQSELDAVIKFCQYSILAFNVHVYTPNMNNQGWLLEAVKLNDAVIVNTRSNNYKEFCLLEKTYYYGEKTFLENPRKLTDPLHYFAVKVKSNK